jgi:hypothetical protein
MRLLALALAFTLVSHGCASFKNVIWPSTVKCAAPITGALVTEIEAILTNGTGQNISDEAIAALEKLAAEHGAELVACIVEQFISKWMQPTGTQAPLPATDAASRAQDFLNRKGVTVLTSPGA